jgi:hypothetical protein
MNSWGIGWLCAITLSLAACGDASTGASDAAVDRAAPAADVDERPPGCGEVPRGYACAGTQLRFCEDGTASTLECPRYTDDAGVCRELSPRYGSYCEVPVASPCRMAVPHGSHDHVYYAHCDAPGAGCVIRVTGGFTFASACTAGLGACDPASPGRCEGDRLVVRCERGQPVAYDCTSFGARCDATQQTCAGVTEGNRCGATFTCAPGLTCRAHATERGVRTCQR